MPDLDDKKRITIEDVAKALNISKSVVSRALNDKYGVKEETRSRVLICALEMGYEFEKSSHKTKKTKKPERFCVVVPRANLFGDNYYGKIVYGIESTLNMLRIGFHLQIVEKYGFSEMLLDLKRFQYEGIIIIGLVSYKNVALLMSSGIPVVLVDTLHFIPHIDRLTANSYSGAYQATDYLLKKHHKRLAFFGSVDYSYSFSERYRGFRERIVREKGVSDCSVISPFDLKMPAQTEEILMNVEEAYERLRGRQAPSAVLCANDQIAFKVYEMAREIGLSIPEDLSVIGFDDVEKCEWVQPKLTSINVSKFELGQEAVRMLIQRIELKNMQQKSPAKLLMLDTRLVKRGSVCDRAELRQEQKSGEKRVDENA